MVIYLNNWDVINSINIIKNNYIAIKSIIECDDQSISLK